ncbi:MAG: pyrroline-5-carboxylate reductase, partial [bacterium]
MNISILGAGVMGSIFARQLIAHHVISPDELLLIDLDEEKLKSLQSELGCRVSVSYNAIAESDVLLLAIKPQQFVSTAEELCKYVATTTVVLSILAGTKIATIRECLSCEKIVRIMPNTPAKVGCGMSGWYGENISAEEEQIVHAILKTTGHSIQLASEGLIDSVTAISGSGPAYVFYFMEQMVGEAVALGLSSEQARVLVLETFLGATELAKLSHEELAVLRANVTSK